MQYLSRLSFHTVPGKTGEVEHALRQLQTMVTQAGGTPPRILHAHFASLGAPDVVFEQEASDLTTLEGQINRLTESAEFQQWTHTMSGLLLQSPKREIYLIRD
jgi:hypothetical protein